MSGARPPGRPVLARAIFGQHALDEMAERQISEESVRAALSSPGQIEWVRIGRIVITVLEPVPREGRPYVLRVFIDIDRSPPVVVTAYRSSKIAKYWRSP